MIYDDAAWHYHGPFPPELPCEAGATCPGMFLAWAILAGLGAERHSGMHRQKLQDQYYLPGQFLVQICAEKLRATDLNAEGNAFAGEYLGKMYHEDYVRVLAAGLLPGFYYVEDSWDNYSRIRKVLDRRLRKWRERRHSPGNDLNIGAI